MTNLTPVTELFVYPAQVTISDRSSEPFEIDISHDVFDTQIVQIESEIED